MRSGVVGYCRVSSQEQAAKGLSMELQKEKITDYCKLHDLNLIGIERDNGISGKAVDNRPGLCNVLNMAKGKAINGLVVYKLDRAFRSTKDALQISDLLRKQGVRFHSITESIDTGSSFGNFYFTILSALAQLESERLSERIKDAMDKLGKEGKRRGPVRYGFKVGADNMLVENPQEQKVIQLVLKLHGEGLNPYRISLELNKRQIPLRKGVVWTNMQIINILKRHGGAK